MELTINGRTLQVDVPAESDGDGVCRQLRVGVVVGQLETWNDEQSVEGSGALGLTLDLFQVVGVVGGGECLRSRRVAHDVVGDRKHVEAGGAVEVDELGRREYAVAPGRVRVELAEERLGHLLPASALRRRFRSPSPLPHHRATGR